MGIVSHFARAAVYGDPTQDDLMEWLGTKCHGLVKRIPCQGGAWWMDSDGVGWCKDHAEQGVKDQEKGVEKWKQIMMQAGQQSLV